VLWIGFVLCVDCDSSGHVSIADGGITPLVSDHTVQLIPSNTQASSQVGGTFNGKDYYYYLTLWMRLLKRKKSLYKISIDIEAKKVGFHKKLHPAILWVPLDSVIDVRNWYINFRLCNDDFSVFFKHQRDDSFEEVSVTTPPTSLL
jgi:hypothetical protein